MLFLCDHPEVDILMVQGVHAAHDLQVLAGAAFMTLACAGFKAAPSLISMCIRQMWRKGSDLHKKRMVLNTSDGEPSITICGDLVFRRMLRKMISSAVVS